MIRENSILFLALALAPALSVAQARWMRESIASRQVLLLFASLLIGGLFSGAWIAVLALAGVAVFGVARGLQSRANPAVLWLSVAAACALLVVARSDAFALWWKDNAPRIDNRNAPAAIVGASYFLLRSLSLWFDAAKGKFKQALSPLAVLNYLLFFPTLVCGPIDRFARFEADLAQPRAVTASVVDAALWRGVLGLFKKLVLADTLAAVAYPQAASGVAALSTGDAWIAFYAYALVVYLDFSGYTDIAISFGALLGFKVPENFNLPYFARNITEFWKRWHISLSEWLRDYVFLPLGMFFSRGIFKGQSLKAGGAATLLAFALCGAWHGLDWHFIVWGLLHGFWVFAHKIYQDATRKSAAVAWSRQNFLGKTLAALLTFHGVCFTWIWFAAPDCAAAVTIMKKMAGIE